MVMDFFEHQEAARRQTGRLVVLYGLAVLATIFLVYLAVSIMLVYYESKQSGFESSGGIWRLDLLWKVGGATLALVAGATLFKIVELRAGGEAVAKALGGQLLNVGTRNPDERKVLNVVEEMSIASGTPCPSVYLLPNEHRINAFAAGYSPDSAVIGVTRGCIEQLSRDELQGVIAHEFSHILNGDMRLNIRLIGLLHGILAIGLVGYSLLRAGFYSSGSRSSRRGGGAAGIAMVGLALVVIGYVGTFFGSLIKAAVSRQREFLADASAVSFTRNPDGISKALRRIGGTRGGARLTSRRATEYSHLYFGAGVQASFLGLLATHPPLDERIKRIDPRWDGTFVDTIPSDRVVKPKAASPAPKKGPDGFEFIKRTAILGGVLDSQPAPTAVEQVGKPTADHLDYAIELHARLPERLKEAVHEARTARSVVYALLLDDDEASRDRQWKRLEGHANPITYEQTRALWPLVREVGPEVRLPLLDLTIPALRTLTAEEYATFRANTDKLIESDERVDPFEWLLRKILLLYLEPHHVKRERKTAQYYNLTGVRKESIQLVSALAYFGHKDEGAAMLAFKKGSAKMGMRDANLLPESQLGIEAVDAALDKLSQLTPRYKKVILQACAACISADREITVAEGELFRGIADVLDCPMPPLLPGQTLG